MSTKPQLPPLLESVIGFNVDRLSVLVRRHFIRALKDYDLTPEQWQVIVALKQGGGTLSQTEVAYVTSRDRHTISRMLDRMDRAGWIERRPDVHDKRAYTVVLTPKAGREYQVILSKLYDAFGPVFAALTSDEEAVYLRLTKKLIARLEE